MLYDIQKKLMEEKGRPFKHDDDHYYYIIHPDHIKNYIMIKNDTDCDNSTGNCSQNQNQNKSKTFTINITQENNETIIIPPSPCGNKCKNGTINKDQNNDDEGLIERKTITFHDFDNTAPFPNHLLVTHEFQNVSNQTKSARDKEKIQSEQNSSTKNINLKL